MLRPVYAKLLDSMAKSPWWIPYGFAMLGALLFVSGVCMLITDDIAIALVKSHMPKAIYMTLLGFLGMVLFLPMAYICMLARKYQILQDKMALLESKLTERITSR